MQKLVWKNSIGDEIDLTSGNYGITEWEGFANTSLNVQSQQVPFQDGGVFLDALMEQRELSVTLKMQDNGNLETRYRLRRELIHILNPKLGEGYLIYTNDFISKRIKCVAQIPLFETHNSNDSGTPSASLAWTACEPYWEDLEETVVTLEAGFSKTIQNDGDVECGIKVDIITSNITNPSLQNITKNKSILLNGNYENNININTNVGEKSIKEYSEKYKTINVGQNIIDICYAEKLKIFIGITEKMIITSKDGEEWDFVYCENFYNYSVNYINETIYICGYSDTSQKGAILKSIDGINWNEYSTPYEHNITSIAYSQTLNLFVMTGAWVNYYNNGAILTSQDGINWNIVYTFQERDFAGIVYAENLNRFVVVGDRVILYSNDGINWTKITITGHNNGLYLKNVAYSGSMFVSNGNGGATYISEDGINWQHYTLTYSQQDIVKYIKQINSFVIARNSRMLFSTDGINWDSKEYSFNNYYEDFYRKGMRSCCYSSVIGKFVMCGLGGLLCSSTNIKNNILKNISYGIGGFQSVGNNVMSNLKYSKSLKKIYGAVISGDTNYYITTEDGVKWEGKRIYTSLPVDFVYSEKTNLFVGFTWDNKIALSTDGYNWTYSDIANNKRPSSIGFFEKINLFIICGKEGFIYTSSNGYDWTEQTSGTLEDLNYIYYNDTKAEFYCCGNNGVILKSQDGINWTQETIQITNNIIRIGYFEAEDIYIVACNQMYGSDIFYSYAKIYSGKTLQTLQLKVSITPTPESVMYNQGVIDLYINDYKREIIILTNDKIISSKDGEYFKTETNGILDIKNNLKYIYLPTLDRKMLLQTMGIENISVKDSETNIIQNLDKDSNITLGLGVGNNDMLLSCEDGDGTASITYRQKYIGV